MSNNMFKGSKVHFKRDALSVKNNMDHVLAYLGLGNMMHLGFNNPK